jgi:hypothetical protein
MRRGTPNGALTTFHGISGVTPTCSESGQACAAESGHFLRGRYGAQYALRPDSSESFDEIKVGDKVDLIWTEALLVSLDRGK